MSGDGAPETLDPAVEPAGASDAPAGGPAAAAVATAPQTFYLVRHGVTAANLGRARAAFENEPLLPEGREQAKRLAEEVRALGVEAVWTSPLDRAHATAEIVAAACGLSLEVDAGLAEIGAGTWAAEALAAFDQSGVHGLAGARGTRGGAGAPHGAQRATEDEDMGAATARVTAAIERMLAAGRRFVAVTHLGPIRIACVAFGGEPWDRFGAITPGNCQLVRFDRAGEGWTARFP